MGELVKRKDGENLLSYFKRITNNRIEYDLDYAEWAKIVCNKNYVSENGRKAFYVIKPMLDLLEDETISQMPQNKLDEVRDIIGELDIKKSEIRNANSKLNKIKKEFIRSIELANDIKEYWDENDFKLIVNNYIIKPVENAGNKAMILQLSDWHIGLIIDNCKNNSFNLKIAKQRINKLMDEVHKYIELYDMEKIYVVSTGDLIEHCYMRANQHQNVEFYQSEQISETQRLIMDILVNLSKVCYVEFSGISGNHDRSMGDKNISAKNDNANTSILKGIQDIMTYCDNDLLKERLTINTDGLTSLELYKEICGVKCKFIHGDERIKDGKQLIQTDISMNEDFLDVLFRGHWHNFKMESENNGRYIITSGCLSGYNDYSTKFGCGTLASQTICIVQDGKIELIKDIQLQ